SARRFQHETAPRRHKLRRTDLASVVMPICQWEAIRVEAIRASPNHVVPFQNRAQARVVPIHILGKNENYVESAQCNTRHVICLLASRTFDAIDAGRPRGAVDARAGRKTRTASWCAFQDGGEPRMLRVARAGGDGADPGGATGCSCGLRIWLRNHNSQLVLRPADDSIHVL